MLYNFVTNQWDNIDLTRLNRNITLGANEALSGIVQTAFQTEPYPVFWAVRADGQLIGLVFNRQDQVFAWFRINMTDELGYIESATRIPQGTSEEQISVAVRRTINGIDQRYFEYFMPHEIFNDLSNAFLVHSGQTLTELPAVAITAITQASPCKVTAPNHGLTTGATVTISGVLGMTQINQDPTEAYTITVFDANNITLNGIDSTGWTAYTSGGTVLPVTNTVTGLQYLQGKTVTAVGDNALVYTGVVPASGAITLDWYANVITVGLPYTSTIRPTKTVVGSQTGTSRGMRQKLNRVTLSIYQGIGGKYGTDANHMYEINYGSSAVGGDPSLFTGEVTKDMDGDWDDTTDFYITNDTPWPMTIRGMVFRMEVNPD